MHNYRELKVWQRSIELVQEVYKLVKKLPKEETYCLSDQMRRAAVSIPSNIAEGQDRNSRKEFIYFLSIARGSKSELDTQVEICLRIGYFNLLDAERVLGLLQEVSMMITSLITKLSGSNKDG